MDITYITKEELDVIEDVQKTLNEADYVKYSSITSKLYRITARRRSFKNFLKQLFSGR